MGDGSKGRKVQEDLGFPLCFNSTAAKYLAFVSVTQHRNNPNANGTIFPFSEVKKMTTSRVQIRLFSNLEKYFMTATDSLETEDLI